MMRWFMIGILSIQWEIKETITKGIQWGASQI